MTILRQDLPTDESLTSELVSVSNIDITQITDYPDSLVFPRQTPSEARDIDQFDLVLQQVIEAKQEVDGIPEDRRIVISWADPDKEFKSEVVAFKVLKREPGAFGKGKPGNPTHRSLSPRHREEKDDPENPGMKVITYVQEFDNWLEVTNWASTSKQASKRALWVQDMFVEYAWHFASQGFGKLLFIDRGEDKTLDINTASRIFGRPMRYYIRTQRITTISEAKLRKVRINLVALSQ